MKKTTMTLVLGAVMLLCSCGTHTATGAYTGASLGGMIGSAVGGMSGKANGSAVGTIVGAAGGAAVGGAIGSAMDKKQNSGRAALHVQAVLPSLWKTYRSEVSGRIPPQRQSIPPCSAA